MKVRNHRQNTAARTAFEGRKEKREAGTEQRISKARGERGDVMKKKRGKM